MLGNERAVASAVGEIQPHAEWYDYGAKYDEGGSDIIVPADIPVPAAERVRGIALDAFRALELSGMARALLPTGRAAECARTRAWNMILASTDTSVYARLFEAAGVTYPEVLDRLVQLALERHARRARYRY